MFRVRGNPTSVGVLPFDPAGAPATWQASANAFNINDSFNTIQGNLPAGVVFQPPAANGIIGKIKAPEWDEYNLSVQQELNRSTVLIVNYVGNHGSRISYSNAWPNAYDYYGLYEGTVQANPLAYSYGTITQYKQGAVSNYQRADVQLEETVLQLDIRPFELHLVA